MTITTLHGDCAELLPTLVPGSVQCIVTSPPYFGLRDYGIPPTDWPAVEYVPMAGLPPIVIPAMRCCLGLEHDPLAYVGHLVHVFRLARPALRDDGTAWLNLGDSYAQDSKWGGRSGGKNYTSAAGDLPRQRKQTGLKDKDLMMIPARAAMALQADGWYLRNQAIWHKPNAMPESVRDRLTNDYEPLYLLAKSPRYYFDAAAIAEPAIKGAAGSRFDTGKTGTTGMGRVSTKERADSDTRNRRAVWRIATEALQAEHYAPMPQALVEPCILAGSSPQACEHCGAPWVRVQEQTGEIQDRYSAKNGLAHEIGGTHRERTHRRVMATAGWSPTCTCPDATGAGRCVVLDPFAGSGTVLRVAERLQRSSIGIDLNGDYIELQHRRTNGVQVELFV